MAVTLTRLASTLLGATTATVYTAPHAGRARIDAMTITNTDTAAQTFSIYLVGASGTASDANMLVKTRTVAAGQTYRVREAVGQVLHSEGTIQAVASTANKLAIYASGVEVT